MALSMLGLWSVFRLCSDGSTRGPTATPMTPASCDPWPLAGGVAADAVGPLTTPSAFTPATAVPLLETAAAAACWRARSIHDAFPLFLRSRTFVQRRPNSWQWAHGTGPSHFVRSWLHWSQARVMRRRLVAGGGSQRCGDMLSRFAADCRASSADTGGLWSEKGDGLAVGPCDCCCCDGVCCCCGSTVVAIILMHRGERVRRCTVYGLLSVPDAACAIDCVCDGQNGLCGVRQRGG